MATLQKLIESEIADFFAGFDNPGEPETPEDMQSHLLARIAPLLASMEKEPIILYRERNPVTGMTTGWIELTQEEYGFIKDHSSEDADFKRVYAAPQLPQPAVMSKDLLEGFEEWYSRGREDGDTIAPEWFSQAIKPCFEETWKACRAAMLQGAEPDFREISNSSTKYFRGNAETSTKLRHPNPIDHGYRSDCECSGCMATARIYAELAVRSPVIPDCWCRTCRPLTVADMRFVVCPECGNKRCPHANDHRNACTGSNEPGQEGSAYTAPQQEADTDNTTQQFESLGLIVTSDERKMELPRCSKHPETDLQVHPFEQLMSYPPRPVMYCPLCEPSVAEWVALDKQLRAR